MQAPKKSGRRFGMGGNAMGTILYYLMTFAEAGLGVVGIRGLYEQPQYTVVEQLSDAVEVREYLPRIAAETDAGPDGTAAFKRLFDYITGSNAGGTTIAMTAPVAQYGESIGRTMPVQSSLPAQGTSGAQTSGPHGLMRFFLPRALMANGPPAPRDPAVRITTLPAERLAVQRFSGIPRPGIVAAQARLLLAALDQAGRHTLGEPFLLTYDAPFTIPIVRRNEVAVLVAPGG